MIRSLAALALAAIVAAPVAATAAERNDPGRTAKAARAIGGAVTPYVRVGLIYDYEFGVVRSKGVSGFRRVATGLYCIRPTSLSASDVAKSVPVVGVDYSGSSGNALIATYRSLASSCSTSEIAVYTIRGDSGRFIASNLVGFSILVP